MELLIATKPNQVKMVVEQTKEESGNLHYIASIYSGDNKAAQLYSNTATTIDPYREDLPALEGFTAPKPEHAELIYKHIKRTVLWFLTFVRRKVEFEEESLTKDFDNNIPLLKIFLRDNSYSIDNGKYSLTFIPLSFTTSIVRNADGKEIFRVSKFGTFKSFRDRDGILAIQFAKGRPSSGKKFSVSSVVYIYDQDVITSAIYWRKLKDFQLYGDDLPVPIHFGPINTLSISDVHALRSVLKHRLGLLVFVPIKDTYPRTPILSSSIEVVKPLLQKISVQNGKIVENTYGFYTLKAGQDCTIETECNGKKYTLRLGGDRKVYALTSFTDWTLAKLQEGGYL